MRCPLLGASALLAVPLTAPILGAQVPAGDRQLARAVHIIAMAGFSSNVDAPGAGIAVTARVRQWPRARLDGELGGGAFFPDDASRGCTLISPACETRVVRGLGLASAVVSVGPGAGIAEVGGYLSAGAGVYAAGGEGCLSVDGRCREDVGSFGVQWTLGAGTRFRVRGLRAIAGARVTSLEAVTSRRAPLIILHFGPEF